MASDNMASASSPPPPNANTEDEIKPKLSKEETSKYGYDLFPERRGTFKPSWGGIFFKGQGTEYIEKFHCEENVYGCLKTSPIVKLMMSALKSAGCEIDIRRHLSCELCDSSVTGGYDPEMNQIVICQNRVSGKDAIQGVLAHEMIHMFDYCRAKLDFTNLEHLACTEIRAANLMHCSFMSAWITHTASPFKVAKSHADCVKLKAVASVISVRNVTPEKAWEVVNKVFDKCYNDLEPVGRRIRRNSNDMNKAYQERFHYGYGNV